MGIRIIKELKSILFDFYVLIRLRSKRDEEGKVFMNGWTDFIGQRVETGCLNHGMILRPIKTIQKDSCGIFDFANHECAIAVVQRVVRLYYKNNWFTGRRVGVKWVGYEINSKQLPEMSSWIWCSAGKTHAEGDPVPTPLQNQ